MSMVFARVVDGTRARPAAKVESNLLMALRMPRWSLVLELTGGGGRMGGERKVWTDSRQRGEREHGIHCLPVDQPVSQSVRRSVRLLVQAI